MQQLPNVVGYIWDEVYGQGGPNGWDPHLYWPWENVRMLLTFLLARMKADKLRAVVLMYRPVNMNPPLTNNMGFR